VQITAQIRRLVFFAVVPLATGAASWVNPPPVSQPSKSQPQVTAFPKPSTTIPRPQIGLSASSGISVARWEFSPATPGRPVYLTMTLAGTQAAIDRIRANSPLTIQVHWRRNSASGAPDLTTDLTVGQPGLADALAGEVRRQGYFEWHSWARKDTLSPGAWTVSLSYPDGTPLTCGQDAQPCRFTLNVG
jgi:hypothetical protein